MTGTKPTHIVVRSFRGHQLYLTAFNSVGFLFDWSSKRENAVRVSHGVALELVEKASRQYGAKCAAEDADGVLSQGMVAQKVQQQQARALKPVSNQVWLDTHKDCECERDCHFGDWFASHRYAQAHSVTIVRTPFGRMAVCQYCADNCLAMYANSVQEHS